MKLHRMYAILLEEFYITKRSFEVILDLFYFSIITVVVFGLVTLFLVGEARSQAAYYILLGMLLWEIIRVTQYTLSVGSLWEIWSKNLSNLFVTPLNLKEYLGAQMISGAIKALLCFFIISLIALYVFQFNIYQVGAINLMLFFINLILFSWSFGIMILGIIFRYGTRIQAFAWSLIFLVQPLSANVFPLDILPMPLRSVAYILPPTYVFEAARQALSDHSTNWNYFWISLALNVIYLILAVIFFNYMFNKSKEVGQFARNES